MANKNFEIKNGLTVAGTERISSAGAFSGSLASSTTATTQAASDNTTKLASTAYVTTALANLVDGAPSTLNTLNEIAAALNDDAALNTTLTTSIAAKLPLAGGTLTGNLTVPYLATTSYIDLNNSGNRGKIGWSGNHTYVATTSSVGSIIFKNNVGSTASPQTGGDTLLTIADGPKVGIGETNPNSPLHVKTTNQSIQVRNTGNDNVGLEIYRDSDGAKGASFGWGNGNANLEIKNYRNDGQAAGPYANIDFFTGGTTADSPDYAPTRRMRIQQTGEVGIGTDNPEATLQIGVNNDSSTSANSLVHLLSSTASSTANGFSHLKLDCTTGHNPGDIGAQIMFNQGYHGGNQDYTQPVGAIRGRKTGPSNNYGGGLQFMYQPDSGSLGVLPGMTMTGTGRVGIGIDAPGYRLHVNDTTSSGAGILLTNSQNTAGTYSDLKWQYAVSDSSYASGIRFKQVDTSHGGQLEFYTDNPSGTYTKQMVIDENGHVATGASFNSGADLHVEDSSDSMVLIYETGTSPYTATLKLASQSMANYGSNVQYTSAAEQLTIENYGRALSPGSTSGGIRFRTKVGNGSLSEVMKINGHEGTIIQPHQTFFMTNRSSGGQQTFGAAAWTNITWSGEPYDVGGNYVLSSGIFTAPIAGVYLFTGLIGFDTITATNYVLARMVCSSAGDFYTTHEQKRSGGGDYGYDHAISQMVYLGANETVRMQVFAGSGGDHKLGSRCNWQGRLLG